MQLRDLVTYLDTTLRVAEIEDTSQNGLQVEGPETVERVAFAVDACQAAFDRAVDAGAQLLIVHHGLLWGRSLRLVGTHLRRIRTLLDGGCGLYAVHLPLDIHPAVGNNAELTRLLGLKDLHPFGLYHGNEVGIGGRLDPPIPLDTLVERLTQATGEPPVRVMAYGPAQVSRVGCVSGKADSIIHSVLDAGFDTFVTGETSHEIFHDVVEWELNVVYGGHYATETLGVKALARHLEERFALDTTFLEIPTGI